MHSYRSRISLRVLAIAVKISCSPQELIDMLFYTRAVRKKKQVQIDKYGNDSITAACLTLQHHHSGYSFGGFLVHVAKASWQRVLLLRLHYLLIFYLTANGLD